MSKPIVNTRQKILDKALEMFNERGIEYVGLRELAAVLDMRVGNITYYFPTKDDLVYEISLDLAKSNGEVMIINKNMTMQGFLSMLQQVFKNHNRFRCLLLSFVHIISQNQQIATRYRKTQEVRSDTIGANLKILASAGYLKAEDEANPGFLVSILSLISRFWISEAAVSFRKMNHEEQIGHYLLLVTELLWPYATAKGRKEINEFRKNLG
jgi:AcrR family transcriptional regulator